MSSYELFARSLAWPTDWAAVYGRHAPLLIEIGFGGGHFLQRLAQERPSANVLGLEISLPSLRRGLQKLKNHGLKNGRVVQTTALYCLWAVCAPESVSEIYINFPDPWPKGGHQHRRLLSPHFIDLLATRLVPEGKLEIATDHEAYAAVIAANLSHSPYFDNRLPTPYGTAEVYRLHTKYESIALAAGGQCHYFKWQRNDSLSPSMFATPKEFPMPHVVLHSPLRLVEIDKQFSPMQFNKEEIYVNCTASFLSNEIQTILIEAYVQEKPLAQRVGFVIRQREPMEYVIGLSDIGFPRPTLGMQLAISRLAGWLVGLSSETEILYHNLPAYLF